MSRLKKLFQTKHKNVLNIYCTAGFPKLESTLPVMQALQQSGVDIIELGMPYSDPLADGEVIQNSSTIALNNGMTINALFQQLANLRKPQSEGGVGDFIPVVLMGYLNPILQYGFEKFCADAATVGIDGLILPDVPQHEYETFYGPAIKKNGLDFIFLVTPETSAERVIKLDALSSGFLYAVSSSSTTGKEKDFNVVAQYLDRLKSYNLKNNVLVGFGIKDKETFTNACAHASGAIIGSAFIKALDGQENAAAATHAFVKNIIT